MSPAELADGLEGMAAYIAEHGASSWQVLPVCPLGIPLQERCVESTMHACGLTMRPALCQHLIRLTFLICAQLPFVEQAEGPPTADEAAAVNPALPALQQVKCSYL